MAETTYRISAGLINVEATGETVYYICAGLPNGWEEPAGAIMNQLQGPNLGADLFNGALL